MSTGRVIVGRAIADGFAAVLAGRAAKPVVGPPGGSASRAAPEEFTELRWITIRSGSRHHPI
jgi:hypothetical protein